MDSVLLAGAFGRRNPGDEALLAAFRRALPDWETVATSADPAGASPDGARTVPTGSWPAVAREVGRSSAVVFAGGTVFKTLHPATRRPPNDLLRRGAALAGGARAMGRKVALVGVGATPLPQRSSRHFARRLARASDLLVARDEESARCLSAADVPSPLWVGADAAWSVLPPPEPPAPAERSGIVVALSHLAGGDDLPERLASALRPLAEEEAICLQPWQVEAGSPAEDQGLAVALAQRLGGRPVRVIDPPADLGAARDRFARARAVLGLRYHSLAAAAAAGTPFAAFAHEPKLAGLARRLDQPLYNPSLPTAELTAAVRRALAGPAPDPAAVRGEQARAEAMLALLRVLLRDGDSDEVAATAGLELEPEPWAR